MTKFSLIHKNILDSLPNLILVIDAKNWTVLYCNEAMAYSLNSKVETLLGKDVLKVLPPEVAGLRKQQGEAVISTKQPIFFEDSRAGRRFDNAFYPVYNDDGDVVAGLVIVKDITQQKFLATQKIENQQRYFTSLIEQTSDVIVVFDKQRLVKYVSPAIKKIFGYSQAEVINKKLGVFLHPDDVESVIDHFQQMINSDLYEYRFEHRLRHKNGTFITVETVAINQFDNPLINGIIIVSRDITERKKAEGALKNAQESLQRVIDSTSDIFFVIGQDKKILLWNKQAEYITGYKSANVVDKTIFEIPLFKNIKKVDSMITALFNDTFNGTRELRVNTIEGEVRTFSFQPSLLQEMEDQLTAILFTCRDVSEEMELHKQLMPGVGYVCIDESDSFQSRLIKSLGVEGHELFMITRKDLTDLNRIAYYEHVSVELLSNEPHPVFDILRSLNDIESSIDGFFDSFPGGYVFLDRVDYLVIMFGFDATLQMLYRMHELARKKRGVLLVCVSSNYLSRENLALLLEEFESFSDYDIQDSVLSSSALKVLNHIQDLGQLNRRVSFHLIQQASGFSAPTLGKYVEELHESRLITVRVRGREKLIEITNKGRGMVMEHLKLNL